MSRNIFPLALSRNISERRSAWWNASLGGFCLNIAPVIFVRWAMRRADALVYRRTNLLSEGVLTAKKTA
jgi:hypothetical protein